MKKNEYKKLKDDILERVKKKDMPIDVRTGDDINAACWMLNMLDKLVEIDEPLGVIHGKDYNMCPKCSGIIGLSAYYCKRCGAYIRETGGWEEKKV